MELADRGANGLGVSKKKTFGYLQFNAQRIGASVSDEALREVLPPNRGLEADDCVRHAGHWGQ
jgi:hypothetical protein